MLKTLFGKLRAFATRGVPVKVPAGVLSNAIDYHARGQWEQAETLLRAALTLAPHDPSASHLLAFNLITQRRHVEAVAWLEQVVALQPHDADARYHHAIVLEALGHLGAARAQLERTISLRHDFVAAHNSLGNILKETGDLDGAEAAYNAALALAPDFASVVYNMGRLRHAMGRIPEAIALYQRTLELDASVVDAHSNYIYWLNFLPDYTPQQIFDAHLTWARQHAEPLRPAHATYANAAVPGRRLRIGYVSPNFNNHAMTYFFESTLAHHDTEQTEIFCYSDTRREDGHTARLRRHPAVWRETAGLADSELAARIKIDQIDMLVDLSGHTSGNRLLMFATKPAPVQITWNGYANTTGMTSMDYRITDALADPPGMTEHLHTEQLLRLPDVYMTYHPPQADVDVNPLPALGNGYLTFGSFNAVTKITPQTVHIWCRILKAVPDSRLLMAAIPQGSTRERLRQLFAAQSVDPSRLDFHGPLPRQAFLALHHLADIALDPFPFNGTTTTCDSLWMGLPPLTLAGRNHASRVGVSFLTNAGVPGMIAQSQDEYVDIAVRLSSDLPQLDALRRSMRKQMLQSPLMDAQRFTRHLEAAYRRVWQDWCDRA